MNSFKLFFRIDDWLDYYLNFITLYLEKEKLIFFINFYSFILKMDENKYRNIYNSMNSNQSYQTYYINSTCNNYQNSTITQQQFNFIKDDLIKYMNK